MHQKCHIRNFPATAHCFPEIAEKKLEIPVCMWYYGLRDCVTLKSKSESYALIIERIEYNATGPHNRTAHR
jgi:hypothetical protein